MDQINKDEINREALELLGLYYEILEGMQGQNIPYKGWHEIGFLLKQLWGHATVIYALQDGITLKTSKMELPITTIEIPSVLVLTRIVFESYYILHQVYFDTVKDEEKFDFEYNCWKLSGYRIYLDDYVYTGKSQEDIQIASAHSGENGHRFRLIAAS